MSASAGSRGGSRADPVNAIRAAVPVAPILIAHGATLAGAVWLGLTAGFAPVAAVVAAVLGAAPLLLAVRGLFAGLRYTRQWVAIALVFYLGMSLAETIATRAQSPAALLLLFSSAAELLLLLRSLRSAG